MNVKPWARMLRGLVVLALAAIGMTAVAVPAHAGSMVVYNSTPAVGSVVIGPGCTNVHQYTYGFSGNWQSTGSGDYTGSGVYGQSNSRSCTGATDYILDQATQTAQFRWHLETFCATGCTSVPCKIWAYIPTKDAGDYHARYDFWADDGNGNLTWLAWPGGNVDQEDNSGWAYLGSVTVGNTHILTVSLNNADSAKPGWYAGAGDIAVNCPAQQVIPAVPSGLQATITNTTTPALSGVVMSAAGGEVTGEIFLQDAAGNPIGGTPTATAVVDSGEQVTYQVPPGVLSNGSTYQWYMKACQGSVCSAPTATQSFAIDISQRPPNGTVTATITGSSASAADAIVSSGACGGSDCATASGAALNVGNDGASPWRTALKFDLSSLPADAQIVGATLDLTQAGCLNNCAADNTVDIYPADSDVTAATTGPQLAATQDTTMIGSGDVAEGTYDVTAAVQGWYTATMPNDGLVLQAADETSASEGVSYYSPTASVAAADLPSLVVRYLPPTAPDAPSGVSALAGDGGTRVTWTPPDNQGDEQGVTGYTVQALNPDGSVAGQATTTGTSAILTGLTDGTSYPVTVTATNAVGAGPAGTASVTPAAVAGGVAQYTQGVQQFLNAQDALEEGSYTTASDAAAVATSGPEFAAALQAESADDTGQVAALATQGLVQVNDASNLSSTLVSAGPSTVTVFTTDDHTYDTEAGTGTSSPVDTPGEDTTDYEFTFTPGTTPVLTG
ncbi:MAG TPA: DNRLRE domain-containing protein, partial [Trebonia sp.]